MSEFNFGGEFVWFPTPAYTEGSHLQRFMAEHGLVSLDALQAKATGDIAWFWDAVMQYLDVQFYEPYRQIVDLSRGKPWPQWCVGGVMNIVHNCLDKWMGTSQQDRPALRWENEEGATRVLTYGDLYGEVNRCANALRPVLPLQTVGNSAGLRRSPSALSTTQRQYFLGFGGGESG